MNQSDINDTSIVRRKDMSRGVYRKVASSVDKGSMIRLKAGVYSTPEAILSTWIDIDKIVPDGILCLYSAWSIHRLTTQIPDAFYVAIRNKRRVVLPEFPSIHLVYISDSILDLGVEKVEENGLASRVYNCERSVCDAIKYRNKIGIDVMAEILKTYLSRDNRDIKKLTEYASRLRVKNILSKFLEIYL